MKIKFIFYGIIYFLYKLYNNTDIYIIMSSTIKKY